MKSAACVFGPAGEMLNVPQSFGIESHGPYLSQVVTATAECIEHPLEIHRHGIKSHVEAKTEQVGWPAAFYLLPHRLVFLHQSEHAAYHLLQHGAEIGRWIFCIMQFGSEETLADAETFSDGDGGHPDIDSEARDVRLPVSALQVAFNEPAGSSEVAANRLANTQAVKRAGERIDDRVRDCSVVLMAVVVRRDKILAGVKNGACQQVYPLGRDRPEIGVHYYASLRLEPLSQLEDHAKRAALAGNAVIGKRQLVDRKHGRIEHQKLVLLEPGGEHRVGGAIRRASVRVDDDGRELMEVFLESGLRGAHDVGDSPDVVVARNPDNDVGPADAFDSEIGRAH